MDYFQIMSITPTRDLITCDSDNDSFNEFVAALPNELFKYRVRKWMEKWSEFLWNEYKHFSCIFAKDDLDVSYYTFCRISYIGMLINVDRNKRIRHEIDQMTT